MMGMLADAHDARKIDEFRVVTRALVYLALTLCYAEVLQVHVPYLHAIVALHPMAIMHVHASLDTAVCTQSNWSAVCI